MAIEPPPGGASEVGPSEDLEDLYENAPCGYLSLRPDGRIAKANATLAAWTGYKPQDLVGKRFLDLLNISGRIFYETHFAPLLRMQGFFHEVALDVMTATGKRLPVLANAVERRDQAGNLVFTRLTIFQAAERRRYERDLVEARAAAETGLTAERALGELREQFIAVLGHDLRNPLASISSGVRLIQKEKLSETSAHILDLMQGSVVRMSGLIDNVLDFARGRLGDGMILDRTESAPLEPILRQVVEELQAVSPDRTIDCAFDLHTPVTCDGPRIGQLASNLIGNAITHGSAEVAVRVHAASDEEAFELRVANGGTPIPPEQMDFLFHPFFRGDVRSSAQGLGLGLHIAAEIARAHGGTLTAVSTDEETRFTFRMPRTV